jgi:hypothetical protein
VRTGLTCGVATVITGDPGTTTTASLIRYMCVNRLGEHCTKLSLQLLPLSCKTAAGPLDISSASTLMKFPLIEVAICLAHGVVVVVMCWLSDWRGLRVLCIVEVLVLAERDGLLARGGNPNSVDLLLLPST